MIVASIKNFFKSLGFYFIPLGVMAFCSIICLANIVPDAITLIKSTYETIAEKLSATATSWNEVQPILVAKMMEKFSDPNQLAAIMNDPGSLVNVLKDTAIQAFGVEELSTEIVNLLQNCVTTLVSYALKFVVVTVIGFFIGFVVLKILLRKYLTDSNMIKAIFVSLLDGVIAVGILLLLAKFYVDDSMALFWVFIVVSLLAVLLITLLEAYLFYCVKKVKFFKIVNFKNIFTLLIGDLIDLGIGVGIVLLCLLIPNRIVGIFVAIPFIALIACILGLNAETYAAKLVKENKLDKEVQKRINQREIEK